MLIRHTFAADFCRAFARSAAHRPTTDFDVASGCAQGFCMIRYVARSTLWDCTTCRHRSASVRADSANTAPLACCNICLRWGARFHSPSWSQQQGSTLIPGEYCPKRDTTCAPCYLLDASAAWKLCFMYKCKCSLPVSPPLADGAPANLGKAALLAVSPRIKSAWHDCV
jgi:hypothetical protein